MHTKLITQKRKDRKRLKLKKAAENQGIVPKPKNSDEVPALRQRTGITVLDAKEGQIPNCPHGFLLLKKNNYFKFLGPCLLFTDGNEKWFSCAVYRSPDLCKYKIIVPDDGNFEFKDARPIKFTYGDGILSKM